MRALHDLNFHHLFYFYVVAREGGFQRAARFLKVSHPTVSAQVRQLEESLGQSLYARYGRGIQLTAEGRVVLRYAESIFRTGLELLETVRGGDTKLPLSIGLVESIPKTLMHALLAPLLRVPGHRLVCAEGTLVPLLGRLALSEVDGVLTDALPPPGLAVQVQATHLLHSRLTFLGSSALRVAHAGDFPACLDGAPLLAPHPGSGQREALERYFLANEVRPQVVAELSDTALTKLFGKAGAAFFCVPEIVASEVSAHYGVEPLGTCDSLHFDLYWVTRTGPAPVVSAHIAQAAAHLSS